MIESFQFGANYKLSRAISTGHYQVSDRLPAFLNHLQTGDGLEQSMA